MSVSCRYLLPLLAVLLFCGLFLAGESHAVYRYRDAAGNLCFTDDWRTIPVELRASAEPPIPAQKVPAPGGAPSTAAPSSAAAPPAPPPESAVAPEKAPAGPQAAAAGAVATAQGLWANPWVKIGAYLVTVVVLFLFLLKLLDYLPSPMLARLILLAFFLGVMTFGYKLYVENMVQGFTTVKDQSVKMLEKSMKRVDGTDSAPAPPQ